MSKPVAEICLYGNHVTGAGWLARTADGLLLGDGEPVSGRTFTEAVWRACGAIEQARPKLKGAVRVFAPGGQRMADTDLLRPALFGDLKWGPATALVISAEALGAAAEEQRRAGS